MKIHIPPPHPILSPFPVMSGDDLDVLTADIAKNGQRRPVALYQGCVWDGRARIDACWRLGIQPRYWLLRKGDPIHFVVSHNARFGEPRSPERNAMLDHFEQVETREAIAAEKKRRAEWMADARREFRFQAVRPEACAVCGKHREMVHAHHSLPLNLQYDLGLHSAIHDHDWLCPVHHRVVHVYISIYITCSKSGYILDNIREERVAEWVKAEEVFRKGHALFLGLGGLNHDRAEWNDKYPHMAVCA